MFQPTPGSRKYIIKDLYTVWLPPIPTDKKIINGWSLKKDDQMWRRTPLPKFYEERRAEEKYIQDREKELVMEGVMKRVQHFDDVLEKYRRLQWHYRIHGYWLMINGEPVYLTGSHWMYLQWTKLDHDENDGYPMFYKPQLDRYYFRQMCWEDPFCLGFIEVGPRGYGKTSELAGFTDEVMTRPPHRRHAAIQSKSETDAKEVVFQEKMVPIFNEYPEFFKPEFSHGTNPQNRMIFRRKSETGKDAKKLVKFGDEFELNNTIKCFPAKVKAVDGKTLAIVISDEIGKTHPREEADVYERHAVHVKCVFRNQKKVGMIIATTSVEEMDQGGDECHEIWLESNPNERDGNGYTASKIYKYLVSGMECKIQTADRFGNIDLVEAEKIMDGERKPFLKDPYKLSMIMRKDPKDEYEAFIKDQQKSVFDTFIIAENISKLKKLQRDMMNAGKGERTEPMGRQGYCQWVGGVKDGDVEFVEDNMGPVTIFVMPNEMQGNRKLLNNCMFYVEGDRKLFLPCNNDLYRSGGDPIRFVKTDDPRASRMAAYGYQYYDANYDHGKTDQMEWITDNMMWQYFGRSEDPEEDYEQVIMLMRLFGHSIMPENTVTDFTKHLLGRGYQHFIIVRKDFDWSVLMQKKNSRNSLAMENAAAATGESVDTWISLVKRWWRKQGHRNRSLILAEQSRDFEIKKRTKYDAVVGWGWTLMSLKAELEDYNKSPIWAQSPQTFFQKYNISGERSTLIDQGGGQDHDDDFGPAKLERLLKS